MTALTRIESFIEANTPSALGLLRIASSLIFMAHGTQKVLGFPAGKAPVEIFSIYGAAGVIELVGGLLLLLGLFTRPVAFILSGQMAVAYWFFHFPRDFFPVNNGGDASILYTFVFLLIVFAGPGRFALDSAMRSRK